MPSIAIIGASSNPSKYGNRAVRQYRDLGWTVYPVNPSETEIEGRKCFPSIKDISAQVDRVALYLPPPRVLAVLDDIAASGAREVFFNPGTESEEALDRARALGLNAIEACALVFAGPRVAK